MSHKLAVAAALILILPASAMAEDAPAPNAPADVPQLPPGEEAPAMAEGSLYQTVGNAVAMAAANAVDAQQQANVVDQASTTIGVGATGGDIDQTGD
ncbi:MAG TPA: RebB family R body protein [Caulobacteraceae bacterium]